MTQRLSHLEEHQCKISSSMGFATPEPIVYPPPTVEDPWVWHHNANDNGEDNDEDDDDYEIEEESE
jgi:hypothetical protein